MKNTKKLKVMEKMKEICSVVAGTVTGCLFPVKQVSAADSVVSGVNNLTSLVTTIIAAVGTVVLAQGIWDFASAYRSHDSGTQTQAIRGIVSGLIMISASAVISLIRG